MEKKQYTLPNGTLVTFGTAYINNKLYYWKKCNHNTLAVYCAIGEAEYNQHLQQWQHSNNN